MQAFHSVPRFVLRLVLVATALSVVTPTNAQAACTGYPAMANDDYVLAMAGTGTTMVTSKSNAATVIGANGVAGMIAYDATANTLNYCNGTAWQTLASTAGLPAADSLDFAEFKDAMTLDASTDIAASGTNVLSITNTGSGNSIVVNDVASDTTPFVIDASGNVGIGTASPAQALQVTGSILLSGAPSNIILPTAETSQNGLLLKNGPTAYGTLQGWSGGNGLVFFGVNRVWNGATFSSLNGNGGFINQVEASMSRFYSFAPGSNAFTLRMDIGTNAVRMYQNAYVDGNVGIGTTSPTHLLSLGGDAARTIWMERSATSAATGNRLILQAGGTKSGNTDQNGGDLVLSSGTATGTGSSSITFKTAPSGATGTTDRAPATAMTILGNGNVGIGTSNPSAPLDITSAGIQISPARTINADVANGGVIVFGGTAGDGANIELYGGSHATLANVFVLDANEHRFRSQAGSDFMRISSTGNVGIGTTIPGAKLDVAGSIFSTNDDQWNVIAGYTYSTAKFGAMRQFRARGTLAVPSAVQSGDVIGWFDGYGHNGTNFNGGQLAGVGVIAAANLSTEYSGAMVFNTTNAGIGGERMRIDKAGNVGIGAAPDTSFRATIDHSTGSGVNGLKLSSNVDGTIGLRVSSAGANFIEWHNSTAPSGSRFFRAGNISGGVLTFESVNDAYSAATNLMTLKSNGNVGIGTPAPNSTLDVKGTIRLSGATSGFVGLAPAAAAGTTTYTLPSADGTSGQQLTTNGAGSLSWQAAGAGGATGTIDVQTFNSSGTWTKPAAGVRSHIECWGGGGSGGKNLGAGGGGGAYVERWVTTSSLAATETVTIGAGGAAKTTAGAGNSGGNTFFGSWVTAYGGAGGTATLDAAGVYKGGGGGGPLSAGSGVTAGKPNTAFTINSVYNYGSAGSTEGMGGYNYCVSLDEFGSCAGGIPMAASDGMVHGGGGGCYSIASCRIAGASVYGGGGGGGVNGAGGTSLYGGAGGAGAVTGVAGTQPSGGGGGSTTGNSGAGGSGRCVVTTY